jgi:hypothetical protein
MTTARVRQEFAQCGTTTAPVEVNFRVPLGRIFVVYQADLLRLVTRPGTWRRFISASGQHAKSPDDRPARIDRRVAWERLKRG